MADKRLRPVAKSIAKKGLGRPFVQAPLEPAGQADSMRRALDNPGAASPADILTLQRTAGNRATTRLLGTRPADRAVVDPTRAISKASPVIQRSRRELNEERAGPAYPGQPRAASAPFDVRSVGVGLPGVLRTGIESLSGVSMDDVAVHYNSSRPAQLNALAYAQGSAIHVAPGQERHLPHEAWHVVQQAQGRVKPTIQLKEGVPVNDDAGLEREANVMGAKAMDSATQREGPEEETRLHNESEPAQGHAGDDAKPLQGKFAITHSTAAAVIQRQIADARMEVLIAALDKAKPANASPQWPFVKDCKAVMNANEHGDAGQLQQEYKRRNNPQYRAIREAQETAGVKKAEAETAEAEAAAVAAWLEKSNPTQVFVKYFKELCKSAVETSAKRKGGEDPVTMTFEDGVDTYSRTYTFSLDPTVGEVHIHWRKSGQSWYPSKMHFKKVGSEGKKGAANQHNISPAVAVALGIAVQENEKLTDKLLGK